MKCQQILQTLEASYAPQGGQRAKKRFDHIVCGIYLLRVDKRLGRLVLG